MPYFSWGSGSHFPLFWNIERGPLGTGVGIKNVENADFSISPNPATDYILLTFPDAVSAKLRMLDVNGKVVLSGNITGDRERLNIEGLESGLYFVEIQNANARQVSKVVVIK